MCSQLIQNVNISFEICANVSGSPNLCKDLTWILCGCPAGRPWLPIRILHGLNLFTADPKCQYFIGNMSMCQGEHGGAAWIPIRIRHRSLYGSYMDPYMDLTWVVYMQMCSQLIRNVIFHWKYVQMC